MKPTLQNRVSELTIQRFPMEFTFVPALLVVALSSIGSARAQSFPTGVEGFESGLDGWTTDNSAVWQVGVPTSGPGGTHNGTNVLATVLGGNYPRYADSRAISPAFVVPTADQNPRLRFWHWYSTWNGNDYGDVEIKPVGSNSWTTISPGYGGYSGAWTRASLDLSAYAGQTVQIALHF